MAHVLGLHSARLSLVPAGTNAAVCGHAGRRTRRLRRAWADLDDEMMLRGVNGIIPPCLRSRRPFRIAELRTAR